LQPAPAEKLPSPVPSSAHLVPVPPRYTHGPDPMDLPCVPFAPPATRPRARRAVPGRPTGAVVAAFPAVGGDAWQASKWVTLAVAAVHEDAVGPLKQAVQSPLCNLSCRVAGGSHGLPYSLGPVYSFFVESHFQRERQAALARLDGKASAMCACMGGGAGLWHAE
jgi:hypothetical protein